MGKIGDCCCCDASLIPDWDIAGFTKGAWSQYGDCCFIRTYTRTNLAEGIQIHFQDLYARTCDASVELDVTGWWVRELWTPNGPPPVGSLYPTPMPNTCWNSYGVVGTLRYEAEREERARQEVQFQITEIYVAVHRVENSCTAATEYYVRVSAAIRVSNRVNSISYSRSTLTATLDACYEFQTGGTFNNVSGSTTFVTLSPIWSSSAQPTVLFKYDSWEDIPDTIPVDLTTSPVASLDSGCFNGHPCTPFPPDPQQVCRDAPFWIDPGPYSFTDYLEEITDSCQLSYIRLPTLVGENFWSTCDSIDPDNIPNPTGDMLLAYCSNPCVYPNQPGCGTSGSAAANSSVSACPDLVYNKMWGGGLFTTGTGPVIRRKASCSPLDLIPCDEYTEWWYAPKTYPTTNSYRDLSIVTTHNAFSITAVCMNPTTFSLVA